MRRSHRVKVLFVSRNFPPLTGGMERLMYETNNILTQHFSVTLIGPSGCAQYSNKCRKVYQLNPNPLLFNIGALFIGLRELLIHDYQLILGGSGLVSPAVTTLQKISKISSLLFIHGLDLVADNFIYQKLFIPFIRASSQVVANSRCTAAIAQEKGIKKKKISIINPGVDTITNYDNEFNLREYYNLGKGPIMLYVGRIIERKGLLPFIEKSLPAILHEIPTAKLLIIGDAPFDAINTNPLLKIKIKRFIELNNLQDNILFLGKTDDTTLYNAYKKASTLIFPLTPTRGDIEGFGMVAIEAASQGTPTVAFDVGGVADAIDNGRSGLLICPNDYQAFSKAVVSIMKNSAPFTTNCQKHAKKFSWERFGARLLATIDIKS